MVPVDVLAAGPFPIKHFLLQTFQEHYASIRAVFTPSNPSDYHTEMCTLYIKHCKSGLLASFPHYFKMCPIIVRGHVTDAELAFLWHSQFLAVSEAKEIWPDVMQEVVQKQVALGYDLHPDNQVGGKMTSGML